MPSEDTYFKPGNPGGTGPKGKRISTWMMELADTKPDLWPPIDSLPAGGQIAMRRLMKAMDLDEGTRDTALIMEHTENKTQTIVHMVTPEAKASILQKGVDLGKSTEPTANA